MTQKSLIVSDVIILKYIFCMYGFMKHIYVLTNTKNPDLYY